MKREHTQERPKAMMAMMMVLMVIFFAFLFIMSES